MRTGLNTLLALVLCIALAAGLVACGGGGDSALATDTGVPPTGSRHDLDQPYRPGLVRHGRRDPSVAFYEVYKDRSWIFSTADATTYSATGLAAGTVYCFMLTGMDSLYNVVVQSPEVCTTTSGGHNRWRVTDITGLNVPSERQYHTAIWNGSKMIVWGGDNDALHRWDI